MLLDFLKANCRLSSPFLILAVFAAGTALLFSRRTSRLGRWWLVAALAGFWFVSTPFGAHLISEPVGGRALPMASAADARGAQAVVVLGGGIISYVDSSG